MKRSLLALLGIFFCIGHASSACIDSDPTSKKYLDHFSWRSNDPQFKPDFCDPQNLAYRVADAVLTLAYVDGLYSESTPAAKQGLLSSGPFQFFSSRIQTFVFEPNVGPCAETAAAYVHGIVDGVGDGNMHICRRLANDNELSITSTLIHEARHQDQDGYSHTTCQHGQYGGTQSASCDSSYSSGGAYAVQAEYYLLLSHLDQLTPAIRQSARANAIQLLIERFNTLPMDIQKGAVLASDDSKLVFYDGKTATSLHSLTQPNTRLIKYNGILNFYDPAKNALQALADGMNLNPKSIELAPEVGDLIDTYQNEPVYCMLFSNRVTCDFASNTVTLTIKDFTPIGFWTYDPLDQSNPTVYIVSKDQRLYSFNEISKTFTSQPTLIRNSSDWNAESFITLGFNGKVLFAEKDPKATPPSLPPPGLNPDDKFTNMITPYYWSKELQEL